MKKLHYLELILALLMVVFGVLTRTSWHLGENIEFVTGLSLAAAMVFSHRWLGFVVALLIMIVSDFFLGNTVILLFTWSAYALAPALGLVLRRLKIKEFTGRLLAIQAGGMAFTLFFFVWTNFGVVVTTNMYEKNFSGVLESYVNALPFLQNQLLGNLLIVPGIFLVVNGIYFLSTRKAFPHISVKI